VQQIPQQLKTPTFYYRLNTNQPLNSIPSQLNLRRDLTFCFCKF